MGDSECLHDQVLRLIALLKAARVEVDAYVDVGMVHVCVDSEGVHGVATVCGL